MVFRTEHRSGAEIFPKAAAGIAKIKTTTDGIKHHGLFKAAVLGSSNPYPATANIPLPLMANTPHPPIQISAKPCRHQAKSLELPTAIFIRRRSSLSIKGKFGQLLPAREARIQTAREQAPGSLRMRVRIGPDQVCHGSSNVAEPSWIVERDVPREPA